MPLKKLSDFGDAEMQMIEAMAGTGFPIDDIAIVLEADPAELATAYKDKASSVYRIYRKGQLKAELELRIRIFKDAGFGSSPAQTLAKKILDECNYKMSQYE